MYVFKLHNGYSARPRQDLTQEVPEFYLKSYMVIILNFVNQISSLTQLFSFPVAAQEQPDNMQMRENSCYMKLNGR